MAAALAGGASAYVGGSGGTTDAALPSGGIDQGSAIVQLTGDPLSTYPATRPAPGQKIDFSSNAVKSYRAQLSAERNAFRQWLQANAPVAQITGQYDVALNAVAVQLNGTSLDTLRSAPQVQDAEYEALYTPADLNDPDLSLVNAFAAWAAGGGAANAGKGVLVGVIDTGIDQTHPCFNPSGFSYPPGFPKGDHTYTTPKVVVARVFNNRTPTQHYTPEALQDHGTHVSGTIACDLDTPMTVDGVTIPYKMSGVAPAAQLGNYNVFPDHVTNARSEDIFDALEQAYQDGMDVVNMSLGGGSNGIKTLEEQAINNLDAAGMVVAVAAGNSGPGHYTIQDPGGAEAALTAGAATVGHFIGVPVTVTGAAGSPFAAAVGDFGPLTSPISSTLSASQGTACSTLTSSLTGKIALINRGTCSFSTKIRNAQAAGAIAVIMVNNVGGDPIVMGGDGTANQPTLPAVMVSLAAKTALNGATGAATTISSSKAYFLTGNNDIMAGFSGQGPTDVDFRVKPDVVAPGVNVLSSIPSAFCSTPPCFAFFQGTSMATPHLAGAAAVVISQHGGWSADEVRSAIVNTADQGTLKNSNGVTTATDPNLIGAGRLDVGSAVAAKVGLDPVSVSFGAVPVNAGQPRTETVTISDLTGSGGTYTLSVGGYGGQPGVTFGVPFSVTVPAGGSTTFTVSMTEASDVAAGDHWATLTVGNVAHEVLYTFVKQ